VAEAAAAARRGELVVLPTDTVYGIGTRPDEPAATAALFEAKGRPRDLELPILVASSSQARSVGVFDERAERLAVGVWPGALTIVLRRTSDAEAWDLGGDPGTVGLRVPRHPLASALLSETGPLAVTSANRSGEPPATSCDELHAVFGERVAVYLCEEGPIEGSASTVVDLASGRARILRRGAVSAAAITEFLGEEPLLDSPPSR
jgi:tRNA threonylcarbamoyl adenosine modification protein (Sua5/YciO/YrdC/YwlC family)